MTGRRNDVGCQEDSNHRSSHDKLISSHIKQNLKSIVHPQTSHDNSVSKHIDLKIKTLISIFRLIRSTTPRRTLLMCCFFFFTSENAISGIVYSLLCGRQYFLKTI